MLRFLFKLIILIVLIFLVVNNWDAVKMFLDGLASWAAYGAKVVASGPPSP